MSAGNNGVWTSKKLNHWDTLLNNWHGMLARYISLTEDAPFWYTEETNTAMLSAAGWGVPVYGSNLLNSVRKLSSVNNFGLKLHRAMLLFGK